MAPRLFALDHNFPIPIVEVLTEFQEDGTLVPTSRIDQRYADLEDWEVLLALHHDELPWDGLITTDTSMLSQPLELSVLLQTRLTLVAVREAGHNPVKATGLLFAYLPNICKRTRDDVAQVWTPSAANRRHDEVWDVLAGVAERRGVTTADLYAEHKLDEPALGHDPLG